MQIEMLQDDRLRAWCKRLEMPEGATEALAEIARDIQSDPDLLGIFSNFHEQTALHSEWHRDWTDLPIHPAVTARYGDRTSMFYLLDYIAALPQAEREYRRLGVSLDIFHDTMLDFSIWAKQYYDLHEQWGFDQFKWMWRHVDCKLFRLGRLQFMLSTFPDHVTAFRHRTTGRILLLGDPATPLRPDGYAEGAGGKPSGEEPWHAVFEPSPAGWRGNRITPQGYTLREQSFLVRSEWERILQYGDTILDLHIPRGEKMTVKECRESFQRAFQFFPTFFPDQPFKGTYCHTWFFTPQLQKFLPLESNIVRFQREFYLYPYAGNPDFLWGYVFGGKYPDPSTAPRDTSLRRAVLDWLAQGNELFDMPGLMLHSPDEWGTQPYYATSATQTDGEAAPKREIVFPAEREPDDLDKLDMEEMEEFERKFKETED